MTLFVCFSHRSDLSKSEVSIGEEIEEVSIEGPDISDKVNQHPSESVSPERTVSLNVCLAVSLNVFQVDESTQDVSVSQLSQSHGADYLEDVA